jgi:serine/threonine protein kinase
LILEEREFDTQFSFVHGSVNIVKLYDSSHVINEERGIDHWVIFLEYVNSGTVDSYLKLKSRTIYSNTICPEKPLTEDELSNYFFQLRFVLFCFFFCFVSYCMYFIKFLVFLKFMQKT